MTDKLNLIGFIERGNAIMMRSLFSGVSGLKSHQTKMDVIGNNISNVSTYGYKSQRTTFKDTFYQTMRGSAEESINFGGTNPSQIGYGASVNTIDVLHTNGGYVPTGRPMDVFIDGEGYLISHDKSGSESYTRVGVLNFDGNGNLVDGNGSYIVGYPIARYTQPTAGHATGEIILNETPAKASKVKVNGMNISFGDDNGAFFNGFKVMTVSDPAAVGVEAEIDIANKLITVTTSTANIDTADLETALRDVSSHVVAGSGVFPATINDDLITVTADAGTTSISTGVTSTKSNGGENIKTAPVLDKSNGVQMIKKPGTLVDIDDDGNYDTENSDVMELTSISIGPDGVISGQDTNGIIIELGQIVLANVPNPEALTLQGNSYYKALSNTGEIEYTEPGEGTSAMLVSGGLENSNVDLANELTDMIMTQRGFQANSRIITVGDEMLQEIVNLKR